MKYKVSFTLQTTLQGCVIKEYISDKIGFSEIKVESGETITIDDKGNKAVRHTATSDMPFVVVVKSEIYTRGMLRKTFSRITAHHS